MKMVWTVALLGLALVCIPNPARGDSDSSIDAILNAPDASSAAYAYAQATRQGGDMLAANKAYVSKMTDLGQPASAFQQAVEVVKQDPADGLAWAVEAYTYADRDNPFDAFTDILLAVRYDQYNLFVTRTAGQLMAWYDSDMVDRDSLADSLRAEIGTMKIRYGNNATFKTAYDEAARIYAGEVTQNQPPQSPQAPPAGESQYPDPNMNPYPYPDQGAYGSDYAPPYPWDWYGYCQPWSFWDPFWDGCGIVAFSGGFRHHHGFDGDRGWNGSRFGAAGARGSRGLTGPAGAIGASGITGLRAGRSMSTLATPATPPGVRGNSFRGFTTSGGASRFSVWHSNGLSGTYRSSGGAFNRSNGFTGATGHYGNFGSGSTRSFSSGGSRSFSGGGFHGGGGYRGGGGGGFRGGGGGFHGGGGGHGGGGHR